MTEWVLALDVGGTKLAAGLMDREGRLSGRQETPANARAGGQVVMARLVELGQQTLRSAGFEPAPADRV